MGTSKLKFYILLFISILSGIFSHSFATKQWQFEHYSGYNGLPNNSISSIFKDSHGFMWFCTDGGLSRYDGYNFVNFHHDPNDSTSQSHDLTVCMYENETGKFWVGTKNGLNLFDPAT